MTPIGHRLSGGSRRRLMPPGKINSNEKETVMVGGFASDRRRLGLAIMALTCLCQAPSVFGTQAAWQVARPNWLETVIFGVPPQDGVLSVPDDRDYCRIEVTEPTPAVIYTSGDVDTRSVLLDPDGREIARSSFGVEAEDNFRITTFLARRGTYYLSAGEGAFSVGAVDGYPAGSYTLRANRLGAPSPLTLGGPPYESAILTDGKGDYFRPDVTEPTAVAIRTSGSVDTGGKLFGPDRRLGAWDDDGGEGLNFRIDTALFRRGSYLLEIVLSHPAFTSSYTLHATGAVSGPVTAGGSGGVIGHSAPPAAEFDLDRDNTGNGCLYLIDYRDDKVYVYDDVSGQRVPAAKFNLDDPFAFGHGLRFASDRSYVVDGISNKVFTY